MNRSRLRTVWLFLSAITAVLTLVGTADGAPTSSGTAKPPKVGHWKLYRGNIGLAQVTAGKFRVTSGHKAVVGFRATLGDQAEPACGTGSMKILGKHKIVHGEGTDPEGSHYNEWFVGKNDPSGDPVDQPIKVTTESSTGKHKAQFTLYFGGAKGGKNSIGEIEFTDKKLGQCDVAFQVKHS